MILDTPLMMCDATALGAITAGTTEAKGNAIDLGVGEDYLGSTLTRQIKGGNVWFNAIVENTAIVAAGAGTITAKLFTHTAATSDASTVVSSGTAIVTGKALTTDAGGTALPDGAILISQQLPANAILSRYLAVGITAATQDISAGAITAFLSNQPLSQ